MIWLVPNVGRASRGGLVYLGPGKPDPPELMTVLADPVRILLRPMDHEREDHG